MLNSQAQVSRNPQNAPGVQGVQSAHHILDRIKLTAPGSPPIIKKIDLMVLATKNRSKSTHIKNLVPQDPEMGSGDDDDDLGIIAQATMKIDSSITEKK